MPRIDQLAPRAVELLQEAHIGILATLSEDGSPHATPVWIDVEPDGSHILVNTAVGHVKLKNIERDPRVSVVVVDSNNHFRVVAVQGTVVERLGPDQGAVEHINKLSKKYTGRDPYVLAEGETRVILRIKPTRHLLNSSLGGNWRVRQGDPTASQPAPR